MLDGRVKTLHPLVHGGLLYIRGNREHEAAVAAHGIQPIDMVVVNLYAFEKTAAQPGVAFGHLIGPGMPRPRFRLVSEFFFSGYRAAGPAITHGKYGRCGPAGAFHG